ncbi:MULTISPECIES: MFS transporter [unclassified Beijerinckia]|uniref:MFS transporter n=1 Tax=unclassified Beijerinckia TaxID=2638183 RepID=UPI0008972704|nr:MULTISPECIES: MFS transporter [unclassified Beijerinckia]MDH7795638.1 MFS family permease [Beijerinckia sp. GAS462]SEC09791.1 Sugar transporter [Beijerinckia sp. 28-YEA-48]
MSNLVETGENAGLDVTPITPSRSYEKRTIIASSFGALLEWYDLYIYAALTATFAELFFPPGNEVAATLASLAIFGAAFILRPIGALVFGYFGDRYGRKRTFLATIWLMGVATVGIGLLPTYSQIGLLAPVLLVTLRLAQGLALGGEVGGAATYLTENAAPGRRGLATSWLQTTATIGLLLSIVVVTVVRLSMDSASFSAWGWRIPFVLSVILLAVSVYLRRGLSESPVFARMKSKGQVSDNPITASLSNGRNVRNMFILLFSVASGVGVLYGVGHFYSAYFLANTLKVEPTTANILMSCALILATPFYVLFGWLSDKIGRKWIMVSACLLAAVTTQPVFKALTHFANPVLERFQSENAIVVEGSDCSFRLFSPALTPCDKARNFLNGLGVTYAFKETPAGSPVSVEVAGSRINGFDPAAIKGAMKQAGWPEAADLSQVNRPVVVLLLWYLVVLLTMVYGPIVSFMVELFPAHLRYTSLSLPFHIGSGWFGGMLPFVLTSINASYGSIYAGLWYPVIILLVSFIVGALFIRETRQNSID